MIEAIFQRLQQKILANVQDCTINPNDTPLNCMGNGVSFMETDKFCLNTLRTSMTCACFGAYLFLQALLLINWYRMISVVNEFEVNKHIDNARVAPIFIYENMVNYNFIVYFLSGILFSFWLHRSIKNISHLNITKFDFSPGLAVCSFFIPIFCFYWPYKVFIYLWKTSSLNASGDDWEHERTTYLIVLWEIFWVLSLVFDIFFINLNNPLKISPGETGVLLYIDFFVCICSAMLCMAIIIQINKRQIKKFIGLQREKGSSASFL